MNPAKQDGAALLVMLPKIWKVEKRVVGADLGMGRFQFHFDKEEDIVAVLEMQPYHFDYWMIALARWQPKMMRDFPSEIPFWIKIEGVPTEFWSTPTFQSIGDAIGETTDVDLDYGKMWVIIDGCKELCFETTVDFKGGEYYEEEEALVTLKFEKLFGHCSLCLNLCHDLGSCPLNPNPEKKKEGREGAAVRKDDRARSYKGVVINGEGTHQENDKDTRRYQGKGKGKMYEEQESRWERVSERGSKRSFSNRNHNKLEDGGSRNRNSRWEQTRRHLEEERSRPSRAMRGERTPPRGERSTVSRNREEPREEGEIRFDGSDRGRLQDVEIFPPGPVQETSPLPGDPDQVNLITGELENGLDLVSEFLEDGTNMLDKDKIIADLALSGEVGMELGENHHTRKEIGSGLELDDEFQNLTDGEGKDMDQVEQVEAKEVVEDEWLERLERVRGQRWWRRSRGCVSLCSQLLLETIPSSLKSSCRLASVLQLNRVSVRAGALSRWKRRVPHTRNSYPSLKTFYGSA